MNVAMNSANSYVLYIELGRPVALFRSALTSNVRNKYHYCNVTIGIPVPCTFENAQYSYEGHTKSLIRVKKKG